MADTKAEKRKRKHNNISARQCIIDVPIMIQEVKKRPCLWDPKTPGYGDRRTVLETWCAVSESMDVDVNTLKMKWKNLRDTHRRIVKNELSDTHPKSNWMHLKEMEFLIGVLDITVEIDDDEVPIKNYKKEQSSQESRSIELEPFDYVDTFKTEYESHDMLDHNSADYNDNNYDLMYLKSLLPFFKNLEPYRKLVVRNKIQDVLLSEMTAQAQQIRSNNGIDRK